MEVFIQCQGCLDNQPNQLAHMEPGGCLYDGSLDEYYSNDDSISISPYNENFN